MKMSAARALLDDFLDFIQRHDQPEDTAPLQEYILEWLEHGDAVVESGGDFGTYLGGVILIVAKWLEDPSILHYKGPPGGGSYERRAIGILDLDHGDALGLDRDYFRAVLLRRFARQPE
jgi:hypothetical protein